MLTMFVQMLRCVPSTPFGWLVVPDVYRMVARSSGATSTGGRSARPVNNDSRETIRSESGSFVLRSSRRVPTSATSSSASSYPSRRSKRSPSATSTRGVASRIPNASSAPFQNALNATAIAPRDAAAKNAIDHSGTLRIAMATRSPFWTPKSSTNAAASRLARSWCSRCESRSSPSTRKSRSPPTSAPRSSRSPSERNGCFHDARGAPGDLDHLDLELPAGHAQQLVDFPHRPHHPAMV